MLGSRSFIAGVSELDTSLSQEVAEAAALPAGVPDEAGAPRPPLLSRCTTVAQPLRERFELLDLACAVSCRRLRHAALRRGQARGD